MRILLHFLILALPLLSASAQEIDSVTPVSDETTTADALQESEAVSPVDDPFAVVYVPPETTNSTEPNTTLPAPWFEDPFAVPTDPTEPIVVGEAAPPVDPWFEDPGASTANTTTPGSNSSELETTTEIDPWFEDIDEVQRDPNDSPETVDVAGEPGPNEDVDADAPVHALEVTPSQVYPASDTIQSDPTEQNDIKAEPPVENAGAVVDGPDNPKTRRCSLFRNLRGCGK